MKCISTCTPKQTLYPEPCRIVSSCLTTSFTKRSTGEGMKILLPTGSATYEIVRQAAAGLDADVVVTGEIAAFLTPRQLQNLIQAGRYDLAIVPGMSTANFHGVEEETGVPVFRGPRHAADLPFILPLLGSITLSRDVPADESLAHSRKEQAEARLRMSEEEASCEYCIRGVKIGRGSRMKVLAEIMDAPRRPHLPDEVERFLSAGADIIDLGFGFDATPSDVKGVIRALSGIDAPLSFDTQDKDLIRASLDRADLILSLHEGNIPEIASEVGDAGCAAVVIPGRRTLEENIAAAEHAGVSCIIADPLLLPVGSGFSASIARYRQVRHPLFFGAGNVVELLDADSTGMNALLAGMAYECGASVIFSSEHSDKTSGSVAEMRRATDMMVLARDRPYPKDLGIDLLVLKEKRRRREPPLCYSHSCEAGPAPSLIVYDPRGNFRIGIEGEKIVAVVNGRAVRGRTWDAVFSMILENGDLSLLDHAAYLGKELFKAELSIRFGRSYEQDGPF
jgi:dihydropteroate synthase-like protein